MTDTVQPLSNSNNRYPVITTTQGFEIKLSQADLDGVEDMVAIGANAAYVAHTLGCCEAELNEAVKKYGRLKQAIQRGVARDEMEVTSLVREQIKKGNITAAIWYQKNKHGWRDSDAKQGGSVTVVNVSTGITRNNEAQVIDSRDIEAE